MAKLTVIDKSVRRGSQDVDYVEILKLTCKVTGLHKIRVRIRSNAYAAQSYARVERWDGSQWQSVHELGQSMKTPIGMYVKHVAIDGDFEKFFREDRDELVALADAILS